MVSTITWRTLSGPPAAATTQQLALSGLDAMPVYTTTPGVGPIVRLPSERDLRDMTLEDLERILPHLRYHQDVGPRLVAEYQRRLDQQYTDRMTFGEERLLCNALCHAHLRFAWRYLRERAVTPIGVQRLVVTGWLPVYRTDSHWQSVLNRQLLVDTPFLATTVEIGAEHKPDPALPDRMLAFVHVVFERIDPRPQRAATGDGLHAITDVLLHTAAKRVVGKKGFTVRSVTAERVVLGSNKHATGDLWAAEDYAAASEYAQLLGTYHGVCAQANGEEDSALIILMPRKVLRSTPTPEDNA